MFLLSHVCHSCTHTPTLTQGGRSTSKRPVETGTQSKGDVDYQWLPEGTLPSK